MSVEHIQEHTHTQIKRYIIVVDLLSSGTYFHPFSLIFTTKTCLGRHRTGKVAWQQKKRGFDLAFISRISQSKYRVTHGLCDQSARYNLGGGE